MARLIDVDKLEQALSTLERLAWSDALQGMLGRVYYITHNQPIVADHLVRCKDCTYWDKTDMVNGRCWCTVHSAMTQPVWYCWAGDDRLAGEAHG